eukprot:scaffold360_cov374-Pavlova_lutheri.AAC.40
MLATPRTRCSCHSDFIRILTPGWTLALTPPRINFGINPRASRAETGGEDRVGVSSRWGEGDGREYAAVVGRACLPMPRPVACGRAKRERKRSVP